jgi:hypothetical protein
MIRERSARDDVLEHPIAAQVRHRARGGDRHLVQRSREAVGGVTTRSSFSRVSQSQPWSRTRLRFSRLAYQPLNGTYLGAKPRARAVRRGNGVARAASVQVTGPGEATRNWM